MGSVTYMGRRFHVHSKKDYLSDILRAGMPWELGIIDRVIELCKDLPPGVIVDGGAMLGTHTVAWATRMPQHALHAWEPLPANMRLLRKNVVGLRNVVLHEEGLSDHECQASVMVDIENAGHAVLHHTGGPVVTRTLDSYDLRNVLAIKLDVEGYEEPALAGAKEIIERDRPFLIIEDWTSQMAVPDGYAMAADWGQEHQTYLWSARA